jgi:SAM-dependent methyltransferase
VTLANPMFHPQGPSFWELAAQALSSTERGYDLLAPKFDYTPFRTPDFILQRVGIYLAPLGPFDAALDICCGTGAAMRVLRPLCRDRVVGLDFSEGMLAEARRRTTEAPGTAALEFVRANALAMPFAEEFDLAVSFGAFGHFLPREQPILVRQIHRVLRPGGRFVFVAGPRPPWWSLSHWMARAFNAAMHVRNWLCSPPFIMYYLIFNLPEIRALLKAHGFHVEDQEAGFRQPWDTLRLVTATKPLPA